MRDPRPASGVLPRHVRELVELVGLDVPLVQLHVHGLVAGLLLVDDVRLHPALELG